MKSERSVVRGRSRFMDIALVVIREEHEFLEEIGGLGMSDKAVASKVAPKL